MSASSFNRRWAEVIFETLARHGIKHVCIAPGSRSTPLTLAAAQNNAFIHYTHFDERGLGHLALGLAKASQQPVAVIVTSGTAVANLYPALIEAGLTGEKLILLTADRPPELIDCHALLRRSRPAGWSLRWITPLGRCTAGQYTSTVPLPSRSTASWMIPALSGSARWAAGGRAIAPGCGRIFVVRARSSATGSSGDRSVALWWPGG